MYFGLRYSVGCKVDNQISVDQTPSIFRGDVKM